MEISSKQACTTLILMLCILHLDYGNALLVWSTTEIHKQIPNNTKCVTKLVLQFSKYSSTTKALMDLHWLPIKWADPIQDTHNHVQRHKQDCTKYIMDLVEISKPNRDNMQSINAGIMLNVPPVKYKTFAARSLSHVATTLWNELPNNIRESKKLDKFKQWIKTHLYKITFNQ